MDKIKEMLEARQAPGVIRTNDGPGSCKNELIFDRPDPAKDIPLTLRRWKRMGGSKTVPIYCGRQK